MKIEDGRVVVTDSRGASSVTLPLVYAAFCGVMFRFIIAGHFGYSDMTGTEFGVALSCRGWHLVMEREAGQGLMWLQGKLLAVAVVLSIITVLAGSVWVMAKSHWERELVKQVMEERERWFTKTDHLTTKYQTIESRLKDKLWVARNELKKAIHDNPDCYFTPAAIVHMDKARNVSPSARVDADPPSSLATHLSRQGAADQWASDAGRYGLCRERVNAFIELYGD